MYRFLLILLSVVGMTTATDAQQRQDMSKGKSNDKILVAYFSATGTTAQAAEKLANATGGGFPHRNNHYTAGRYLFPLFHS